MRNHVALALGLTLALLAPSALAQVDKRDHREDKSVDKRDHRDDAKVDKRDHRDGTKVEKHDRRAAGKVDKRDHREADKVEKRDHRAGGEVEKRDHRDEKVEAIKGRRPGLVGSQVVQVTGYAPQRGAPGTVVSIQGSGFSRATLVLVNGKRVAVGKLTRTELTFTIPADSQGKQHIQLRNGNATIEVGDYDAPSGTPHTRPDLAAGAAVPNTAVAAEPPSDRVAEDVPSRRGPPGHAWGRLPVVSGFSPASGQVDTEVVVRGRRFDERVEVLVDGLPAAHVTIEPEAIGFRVPKGATNGLIVLRHPNARREVIVGRIDLSGEAPKIDREARRRERRARAEARWQERRAKLEADREARMKALAERRAELAATRAERRAKRLEELRAAWQAKVLADPQVQAELALHAERTARIQRALALAAAADRGELVVRLEIVADREDERHARRMKLLETTLQSAPAATEVSQ